MMAGLEPLIYFNWFKICWPYVHLQTHVHHLIQLALSLYLLTFGPDFIRFFTWQEKKK